jgi:hypothetical protein
MSRSPNSIFHEVQFLREHPVMVILPVAAVAMIGFFAYAIYRQLLLGEPFGGKPMSDPVLIGFSLFYFVLGAALIVLYVAGRLTTEVRPDGIHFCLTPFHRKFKHIRVEEVKKYESKTYRPIRDYGGWGIKAGRKGRAYNIKGNRGVYFELKDGRRLLIGSQKPEVFADAIDSISR